MITERVKSHVSNVDVERDTIKEIDYNLPSQDIEKFAGTTIFIQCTKEGHYVL